MSERNIFSGVKLRSHKRRRYEKGRKDRQPEKGRRKAERRAMAEQMT